MNMTTKRHDAHDHPDPIDQQGTDPGAAVNGVQQLTTLLRDDRYAPSTRLLRLQGWRGTELREAVAAGQAHRLAPAFCAVGAAAVAVTGSAWLAAVLAVTAVVGVFARNHPVETVYNTVVSHLGRPTIPRNKAAKRLACALGTAFLGGSAAALAFGADGLGRGLAGVFAVVAAFVTVSNVCIPSMIFVGLWGSERSTSDRLI